jgi:phosphoglycolate phosphatase-like HAD superfamily hydrolase
MLDTTPTLLALDFDGILCDGLLEYFQAAWRAYCQIWSPPDGTPPDGTPPDGVAEKFYRLRPVIETGWEMPVVIRAILDGVSEAEILADWAAIAPQYVQSTPLTPLEIGSTVDRVRDAWIAEDLVGWLALHRFYPGVIDRLRNLDTVYPVIITTKEERFVSQLLQQQGFTLPDSQIFGKSLRQPKAQTLRTLIQELKFKTDTPVVVWFVEDRLKTLQGIQTQPDLEDVRLFLGDWGYNTEAERAIANLDPRIHLLSLENFAQDFAQWV